MKKTILLLGAVGVLMMTGCADEGITTDYGEWVATSEYSMDGTTENYRTMEADATAEKNRSSIRKRNEGKLRSDGDTGKRQHNRKDRWNRGSEIFVRELYILQSK